MARVQEFEDIVKLVEDPHAWSRGDQGKYSTVDRGPGDGSWLVERVRGAKGFVMRRKVCGVGKAERTRSGQ